MAIKKFRILSFKKQKPIVALKKISLSFGKRQILDDINLYNDDEKKFESASWVSFRFAEILPLKLEDKQKCLEIDDPIIRLNYLEPLIRMIRENSQQ